MKNVIIIVCFLVCFSVSAQHPYFGSLNQQLLVTNPSFAGSNKQLRVQTAYGAVYPNYITSSIWSYTGADMLLGKHSGLGVSYTRNDYHSGLLVKDEVSVSYAYHVLVKGKWKIVPSFQATFFQMTLDRTKINFGEDFNDFYRQGFAYSSWGSEIIPSQTKYNADFSAGLLVYKTNFYAGASVLSFTQPDEGLVGVSKRPLTQIYQAGYNFKMCEYFQFNPYAFVKIQQLNRGFAQVGTNIGCSHLKLHIAGRMNENSPNQSLIAGMNYSYKGFTLGFNTSYNNINNNVKMYKAEAFLSINFGAKKTDDTGVKLYY